LPADVKVEGHNQAMAAALVERMHKVNAPPAAVQEGLRFVTDWQAQVIEKRLEADETLRGSTEEALRAEWGSEYKANRNNILSLISTAPEEVGEALLNSRMPDGTPFVGTPAAVKWLAHLARQINPFGAVIPGAGAGTPMGNVDGRIAEIEKFMHTNNSAYVKDEKMQKEYRDLLDAQANLKQRGAAA